MKWLEHSRWTALVAGALLIPGGLCSAQQPAGEASPPPAQHDSGLPAVVRAYFEPTLGFRDGQLVNYLMLPEARQLVEEEAQAGDFGGSILRAVVPEPTAVETTPIREAELVESRQFEAQRPTSTAEALESLPEVQTVNIQRRSTIAFDPRVRGYHLGQVFAQGEGVYWMPVRPDLDSMLSRIDPLLVERISVVPGPYSVRYGPGFAFIDAQLGDTPRFENGYEAHNRLGYTVRANGPQHYAVDTFWGGSADYGYLINYTYRQGNDYVAGNGQKIPSSYLVNNVTGQFGFDLREGVRLETRYDFLDQEDTQIPGQFFDLDYLQTNAFLVSLIDESCCSSWSAMRIDAWHHRTPARGTVRNEPLFRVQERVEAAIARQFGELPQTVNFEGNTNSQLISSGGRWEFVFGEIDGPQLATGFDVRHMRQFIREDFTISGSVTDALSTELPEADMFNPGLYAELSLPMTCYWNTRIGGRVDYVHATAGEVDPNATSFLPPGPLRNDDTLYAFYLANDVQLTDALLGTLSFGQAQRPPTLVERFSDGVFVSVLQSGFSRVVGDPRLDPERLWQIDAGLVADLGDTRAGVNVYYSWVLDYITFRGATVVDPSGAQLIRYFATPLATLTGVEFKAERDLSSSLTAFFAGHYVQGQDESLGAPLWGISPLEGQVGLRWHDPYTPDRLGLELLVRMVDDQDRLGIMRVGDQATLTTTVIEQRTPGFATVNIRGYWTPDLGRASTLRFVAGVENLFDRTYLQHLDLRLPADDPPPPDSSLFGPAFAYAPGITPYVGIDWTY